MPEPVAFCFVDGVFFVGESDGFAAIVETAPALEIKQIGAVGIQVVLWLAAVYHVERDGFQEGGNEFARREAGNLPFARRWRSSAQATIARSVIDWV